MIDYLHNLNLRLIKYTNFQLQEPHIQIFSFRIIIYSKKKGAQKKLIPYAFAESNFIILSVAPAFDVM